MLELDFDQARIDATDGVWLCLRVKEPTAARGFAFRAKGTYTATIKEARKKRSLDANAYFWALCDKLAAVLGIQKVEIYRDLIRNIGGNCEAMPLRNDTVEKFREVWEARGAGWVTEELGPSKLPGYTNIIAYYGSSTYNTAQMSRLIDLVVQECQQQGINTLTERELSLLKENWR
jgi:hypothetical protein